MSDYLIQSATLDGIADAIRAKTGGSALINPEDMASEIDSISSGGSSIYNLFNDLTISSGYYNNVGTIQASSASSHTNKFDVSDADSVAIYINRTVKGTLWLAIAFFDENDAFISRQATSSNLRQITDYIFCYPVPTNAKYAGLSFEHDGQKCYLSAFKLSNSEADFNSIQFN